MAYGGAWREAEARAAHAQRAGWNDAWAELTAVKEAMARLEAPWQLHLANSMAVRYANLLPLREDQGGVRVWANRGTSGIDGCTSTFMGHAIARPGKHLLITGDVAFFYDRNAFWHRYPVGQARILLLNNQGGAIFRMIDGPKQQPELEEFFVTEQRLSAEGQAAEAGWAYRAWRAGESLADAAAWLLADASDTRLLEVFSGNEQAAADLAAHREAIRGALG
jgi:2-succinyl-5-enolpyruvyl-6-hydroxy-3-cyclohexene-1-carboxylate synthase